MPAPGRRASWWPAEPVDPPGVSRLTHGAMTATSRQTRCLQVPHNWRRRRSRKLLCGADCAVTSPPDQEAGGEGGDEAHATPETAPPPPRHLRGPAADSSLVRFRDRRTPG